MDSFRAELVGILLNVVFTKLMLQWERDKGIKGNKDMTLWTYSQASIVAINNMETTTSWLNRRSLIKEFLIISKIQHHLNCLPSIDIRWVEAHQQTMDTREKRLNAMANTLAKMQHSVKGSWKSRAKPMMLPNQVLQVWLHQDAYDQNCKKQARRHLHGPQAEEYIRKKLDSLIVT